MNSFVVLTDNEGDSAGHPLVVAVDIIATVHKCSAGTCVTTRAGQVMFAQEPVGEVGAILQRIAILQGIVHG